MSDTEDFVDVVFGKPPGFPGHGHKHPKPSKEGEFYDRTVENQSAKWPYPAVLAADNLRKLYPKHSLVLCRDLSFMNMPGIDLEPLKDVPLTTDMIYIPLPKRAGIPGVLRDYVELGGFKLSWNGNDYIVYIITVPNGFGYATRGYILYEGPEDPSRLLLLAAGAWANELHDEIWVYDQGYWQKSNDLWREIQKADWKDVILKDAFKKAIQKDVYGFFSSEKIYKDLGIPWKRGLIMYGPPGNGKTISLKAIMKSCEEKGFTPLYVKSFHNWAGDEAGMIDVFEKARESSPCIVILEDLDSLITDQNRSFFLNQVDGLHGNDGLLLIGTTNHFDRLDPGLSTRPSRFDRKYKFDDPDEESRRLYVLYWKKKLENNHDIDFSDELVDEIAKLTERFSFAYLKEAFVSTLVTLAGWDEDDKRPSFGSLIKQEISKLGKQLDKPEEVIAQEAPSKAATAPSRPPRPDSATERDLLAAFDALSTTEGERIYTRYNEDHNTRMLARLSDHLVRDTQSHRHYEGASNRPLPTSHGVHGHGHGHGQRHRQRHPAELDDTWRRERRRRAENARGVERLVGRLERHDPRGGLLFGWDDSLDFGGRWNDAWEGFGERYPAATGTFPVRFNPDESGPSGSDLA